MYDIKGPLNGCVCVCVYDIIVDVKLRTDQTTNVVYIFTYRKISCEIKISHYVNLLIVSTDAELKLLFLQKLQKNSFSCNISMYI